MLQKNHRLPASTRLDHPITYTTSLFVVKVASNTHSLPRFGFVISKAVDKRSTTRNRIRRVFRSCIEEMLPNMKEGKDMLFFLKRPLLEKTREDLYNELHSFFKEKQLVS